MNDLDRFLELELRRLLDPVVAVQPPPRGSRLGGRRSPILAVKPAGIDVAITTIPVVEPVAVTVPVAPPVQV
jgi:hypothetical protein